MDSITKRWMRSSLLITALVLIFAEGMFWYFSITGYYDGAARALHTRVQTIITQLSVTDAVTPQGRELVLRRMVEQFSEKERFELMLIDTKGRIAVSTAGFAPDKDTRAEDFAHALMSGSGVGQSVYKTTSGERVMAVSVVLPFSCGEVLALRMVTSLTLVDRTLASMIAVSLLVAAAVLGFTIWSGVFFIRSIVRPIAVIEANAARIARGSLDVRIDNRYEDEVGKLANAINHMAGELDKTERMKNEFISSVSHELRTPLTSIKGWAETIRMAQPGDAVYCRGIQVIANETDRLYAMVEELLDFSRIQNGLALKCEVLDLAAEVSDAVLVVDSRARAEGVRILWQEPLCPMPVFADAARLRQALMNLLDNALKYSPAGADIVIELLVDGRNAFVSIADEGPGISAEDLQNVKMKFYKGAGAQRGSGIGLAVVEEIMNAHAGSFEIQSEQGKGTTAIIRLPLAAEHMAESERTVL